MCARSVLPQVPRSWVMSSTSYVSAQQQKQYLTGFSDCQIATTHTTARHSLTHFLLSRRDHTISPREHPPQILQKDLRRWIQQATPLYCEFAYAFRTLMMRTQHRQTTTTTFHSSSSPMAFNLYPYHQPTPCSHSSTLHRSRAHWASHSLQMAHVWLVPWPHIPME